MLTKNPHAVALGKLGGSKGGRARAERLSPKRRREIASAAARARWSAPVQPLLGSESGNDEVTTINRPDGIIVPGGRFKPRVLCCGGIGFCTEILDAPFVTPCWCPAGLRMVCAVSTEHWPLTLRDARQISRRIGLRRAA